MKRLLAVGLVASATFSTMLTAPGAHATPMRGFSTSCSLAAKLKFRPSLKEGMNRFAFIKIYGNLRGCSGDQVITGRMIGGSEGDILCRSGVVKGHAAAKARIDWDTGQQSGLNWFFQFNKSKIRGKVVSGLFMNDRMFSRDFTLTPVKGLCEGGNPLLMSKLKGTLKL